VVPDLQFPGLMQNSSILGSRGLTGKQYSSFHFKFIIVLEEFKKILLNLNE
jgi:hypothetical protein